MSRYDQLSFPDRRGSEGMNAQLHRLYDEKIRRYSELAGRWDRQECTHLELKEA